MIDDPVYQELMKRNLALKILMNLLLIILIVSNLILIYLMVKHGLSNKLIITGCISAITGILYLNLFKRRKALIEEMVKIEIASENN